jgi:hypothetical protein
MHVVIFIRSKGTHIFKHMASHECPLELTMLTMITRETGSRHALAGDLLTEQLVGDR